MLRGTLHLGNRVKLFPPCVALFPHVLRVRDTIDHGHRGKRELHPPSRRPQRISQQTQLFCDQLLALCGGHKTPTMLYTNRHQLVVNQNTLRRKETQAGFARLQCVHDD